jgi:1-acyl-sn-glycerol-3-phosphate acyltransferase
MRWLVRLLMQYDLHRFFRRVGWVGAWPPDLPQTPLICYTNHHHFFDGHLAWLLLRRLGRSSTIWMAEWDRFPFFAAVGAQPFPPDDPSRRAATLRRTARWFRDDPSMVLVYFPTGALQPPEAGVDFEEERVHRIARLYPKAHWWPVALHVTWRGDARPTALLHGGAPHPADGQEPERLAELWHSLCSSSVNANHTLLGGHRSASDVWDFSFAASFFERYL